MRRAVLLGFCTAVVAAGCGGGAGGKVLSHDEFVKQANAICTDYNNRIAALGTPQGLGDLVAFAQKGSAIAAEDVDKFAKLKPPKADAAGAADFVAAGRTVIDQLRSSRQRAGSPTSAPCRRSRRRARPTPTGAA